MLVPRNERGIIRHSVASYGQSSLGAPLEVWLPRDGKAELLLISGIHGDEPETTVILSTALRSLPVDKLRAAVILGANPDGLSRGTRANAAGVDLNRNFPAKNWQADTVKHRWTDDDPRDVELSPGSQPASEPETKGLISLVDRLKPKAIVALHGTLDCIDDPDSTPLGQWLSQQTGLRLVNNIGFPTPGSFGSWLRDLGISVITYELPHASIFAHRQRHEQTLITLLQGLPPLEGKK